MVHFAANYKQGTRSYRVLNKGTSRFLSQYVSFAWANIRCYALKIVLFSVLCIYTVIQSYIVCMHTCMHTHIHTHMHTYIQCIRAFIHTYISTPLVDQGRLITSTSSRTFLYIHAYTYTIHTYIHVYIHTYINTYTHIYIYMYIHAYIHTYQQL